jgi:sigma-B regulation protein RsbU (phosphoserine phosphatase)
MNLVQEKESLQEILNSLTEGVIVADKDGAFLFFNSAAERILGIGYRDIAPANWTSVYGCYRSDKVTPYLPEQLPLTRAIQGEEVKNELIFIKNLERPDGLWISVSAGPIKDTNGSINGGSVILRDITEQRNAHEKYELFARAVEQTADTVLIANKQGIIEYVNPAFESTTGYNRQEALGQTPRIVKSGKHDRAFYENLWKTICNGQPYRGTIINKKKNGELYWSEQTITPMKDNDGNITNFVSVLKDITDLKKKHEQEIQLRIAHEVQQRLLNAVASVPGFDIAGVTYSAVETSGDYFDFIPTPDGCLWIAVGDVSGHGIGAALIMVATRAYLRAFVKTDTDPASVLTCINQELVADLQDNHFVTLILARIDPHERSLTYASAGHVPAYLLGPSGEVDFVMRSSGIPLGFMQDYTIERSEPVKLSPENIAVFFTDGILEAASPDGQDFGFNRTLNVIRNHRQASAQQMVKLLYQEIRSFSENQPQEDDITSVVCKVNPID